VRLAFATVVKLSPPHQAPTILNSLLSHAAQATTTPFPAGEPGQPNDEELTYLFAFVDCLKWIEAENMEYWLDQLAWTMQRVTGTRRTQLNKRIWDCISSEMGGERGFKAVEWWVNGGKSKILDAKL